MTTYLSWSTIIWLYLLFGCAFHAFFLDCGLSKIVYHLGAKIGWVRRRWGMDILFLFVSLLTYPLIFVVYITWYVSNRYRL